MAKGYIKGDNGKEIEIVDVTARQMAENSKQLETLATAAIPAVNTGTLNAYNRYDYTIDYIVGEPLYACYKQENGVIWPYEIKTEITSDWQEGGFLFNSNAWGDEMWSYPDVKNNDTQPWYFCKKLKMDSINEHYAKYGLTGTQKLTVRPSRAELVIYDGTNADTANFWFLNRPSSVAEWQNKFPEVTMVSEPFKQATRLALPDALGVYNVKDYGISPDNADNTLAFQTLVEEVNENGGGVIFVPSGVYRFDTAGENSKLTGGGKGTLCCVKAKNYVSIRGESLTETVFKVVGNSAQGVAMFGYLGDADTPLTGCTYENFTVDASEATIDTYSSDGKAFFYQYLRDCVFRDLRLIGTPATAMGNDFLDNVVIDSVYVYNAGRIHAADSPGGAGIGIGTGGFEHENFIVRNCICDSCGHFGIFCEDQALFTAGSKPLKHPKGMTIANNIVRNGRNYGIGLRGGDYALVTGNNVYNNANGGIYLDFGVDSSAVVGNLVCGEVNGLCFGRETDFHTCNKVSVVSNTFIGCTNAIVKDKEPTNSIIENNVTI